MKANGRVIRQKGLEDSEPTSKTETVSCCLSQGCRDPTCSVTQAVRLRGREQISLGLQAPPSSRGWVSHTMAFTYVRLLKTAPQSHTLRDTSVSNRPPVPDCRGSGHRSRNQTPRARFFLSHVLEARYWANYITPISSTGKQG